VAVAVSRKKDDRQLLLLLPLFFKRSLEKSLAAYRGSFDNMLSMFDGKNSKLQIPNNK
jgi:hypothetical protein